MTDERETLASAPDSARPHPAERMARKNIAKCLNFYTPRAEHEETMKEIILTGQLPTREAVQRQISLQLESLDAIFHLSVGRGTISRDDLKDAFTAHKLYREMLLFLDLAEKPKNGLLPGKGDRS